MTAASDRVEFDWQRERTRLAPAPRSGKTLLGVAAIVAVCEIAGMASLIISYTTAQTTASDQAEFAWFWLGMFCMELPLIVIIARRATSGTVRYAALILLGIVTYAPKLLRNPTSPDFHDELAHWRDVYNIVVSGELFHSVPIVPIISRYPGLHTTVAALVNETGLTIWQSATLLLIVLHVACFLGIAALAQAIGFDSRTAALAAIIYSFNSSFLYFDTEFGYESMAITILVWALFAFVQAIRADPGRGRVAWCCVTVLLSAGTVVTHHLSAINLTIIMALISLALSIPRLARRPGAPSQVTSQVPGHHGVLGPPWLGRRLPAPSLNPADRGIVVATSNVDNKVASPYPDTLITQRRW